MWLRSLECLSLLLLGSFLALLGLTGCPGDNPTADFTATPSTGTAPLSVAFLDASAPDNNPITAWMWDFGDGNTSTEQNPSHVYAAGTYTVSLTVSTAAGRATETKTGYIVATVAKPSAAFSAEPLTGTVPLVAAFTDASMPGTFPITSWQWDFGDGGGSTEQNPVHTYTAAGSYSVSLSISTEAGSSIESKSNYINVMAPPMADFDASPASGLAPLTVVFADASSAGSAPISAWWWDFGDGATATEQNPTHTYAEPGTYSVSLTVSNEIGSSTETKTEYITVTEAPSSAFSAAPENGTAPLDVTFTDLSTPGSSPITGWLWVFGDGATSAEENPVHTYVNAGRYDVSLSVVSAVGSAITTKAGCITVTLPPSAAFSGTPTTGTAPLEVNFTDLSVPGSASIASWMWDFGDGGVSTEQNPIHTYTSSGTFGVSLTVATGVGNSTEVKSAYISVAALPSAAFSASPTAGTAPLAVTFTDRSTAGTSPITSWLWDFGDGGSSTEQNPVHTYTSGGTFGVSLTVTTGVGSSTQTQNAYIAVAALPVPAFSVSPRTGSIPLAVTFTDRSTHGTSPITSWRWDFGDGGSSAKQNPVHTYASSGTYGVSLTVTTNVGTVAAFKPNYINVTAPPQAAFSGTPLTGAVPLAVTFTDESTAGSSPITSWRWDFGDGSSSTERNPVHTYAKTGEYSVSLSVTTVIGSSRETKEAYCSVTTPPTATFLASPVTGIAPLSVTFTDTSTPGTSPITSWAWNFGDGYISAEQNPTHTYASVGTYDVSLTVTTTAGSDTETKTGCITAHNVRYVRAEATGGTGLTWENALGNIQEAVDALSSAGGEVWVAAGTYMASSSSYVVAMAPNVEIYGGFAGTETSREQRDWTVNKSVIDGANERSGVSGANDAVLDGFIIRNGHASNGGGMYNKGTSPTVSNCTFQENSAIQGGGMYNISSAAPTVTNCTFNRNTVSGGQYTTNLGGGMLNDTASPVLKNCLFTENSADFGGGISVEDSSMSASNCVFSGNTANLGGGVYESDSTLTLLNCTFTQNAADKGGAIYDNGGFLVVRNCILWGDKATLYSPEICEFLASTIVVYSCIAGGHEGTGNFDADPLLLGTKGSMARIRPESPCIDAGLDVGTPDTDIRGIARPQGTGYDLGAYELDDSDGDGTSDSWEQSHFGALASLPDADPDGDGLTNLEESIYGTDPLVTDSDGDGLSDGDEISKGWDPTVVTTFLRVNPANTSGVEDGLSWATAFTSIQAAVDRVESVGEGEVWVAQGTYTATGDSVLTVSHHVDIYGSFAGTETIRNARTGAMGTTIIDGEGTRSCVRYTANALLDGFLIRNGRASDGGGMLIGNYVNAKVRNCIFLCNTAMKHGGAIYNSASWPVLTNCLFSENTASYGGGMYSFMGAPTLTNCTFTGNRAGCGHGAGIYSEEQVVATLTNCILWGDIAAGSGVEIFNIYASSATVNYSCVEVGLTGTANTALDPLFVDAANGNLQLQAGSPCIDTGTAAGAPDADILGILRPQGGGYDMGAYEYVPARR